MKNLHVVLAATLGAAALAACGGKVVVDAPTSGGTGGAGGASGTAVVASTDGSPAAQTSVGPSSVEASSSFASVGTGTPGCNPNEHCAEAISPPMGDPNQICPGSMSDQLYNQLKKCVCAGPCATQCGVNVCLGMMTTPTCMGCIQSVMGGCGAEFQACSNDV